MSATLADLAPAEKQKVAGLIRSVVEKERAIKELEAAAEAAAAWHADKAAQLAEQNAELARENTSLRAKLSHAFDLLRTYQHKCRVLDATVQITSSRPSSPTCPPLPPAVSCQLGPPAGVAGGATPVDAQQLAYRLAMLGGWEDGKAGTQPPPCTAYDQGGHVSVGHAAQRSSSVVGIGTSMPLSPVAEGPSESSSPSHSCASSSASGAAEWGRPASQQQEHQGRRHHTGLQTNSTGAVTALPQPAAWESSGGGSAATQGPTSWAAGGAVAPCSSPAPMGQHPGAPAAPQLEPLKMLAQALLEAQAEVAAKQHHQRLPTPTPVPGALAAAAVPGCAPAAPPVAPLPGSNGDATGSSGDCGVGTGVLVFDASLGPHGGYLISRQGTLDSGGIGGNMAAVSCSSEAFAPAPLLPPPPQAFVGAGPGMPPVQGSHSSTAVGRAPLAALQQQQKHEQEQQQEKPAEHHSSTSSSVYCMQRGLATALASAAGRDGSRCSNRLLLEEVCLVDLVADVEDMMVLGGDSGPSPVYCHPGGAQHRQQRQSGQRHPGGGSGGRCGGGAPGHADLYEENDLLDVIAQL